MCGILSNATLKIKRETDRQYVAGEKEVEVGGRVEKWELMQR